MSSVTQFESELSRQLQGWMVPARHAGALAEAMRNVKPGSVIPYYGQQLMQMNQETVVTPGWPTRRCQYCSRLNGRTANCDSCGAPA